MTEVLDLLVADFVVSLVGIGSFAFGDVASFNVGFNELGNLKRRKDRRSNVFLLTSILVRFIDSSPTL